MTETRPGGTTTINFGPAPLPAGEWTIVAMDGPAEPGTRVTVEVGGVIREGVIVEAEDTERWPPEPGDPGFVQFHEDPEARGRGRFTCDYLIDGWTVGGTYWLSPQGLTMTSIWLAPQDVDAGLPVTPTLLRSISVLQLLDAIRQRYTWRETNPTSALPQLEVRRQPGRRRSRRDDPRKQAQLRRIAIAYLDEQHTRGVHRRLASRFRITPDEVKARIRAARDDGWLNAATVKSGSRLNHAGPRLLADKDYAAGLERRTAHPTEGKDE